MKRNVRRRWSKKTINLTTNHSWKAPPGYNVFVADRGAVRFNVPQHWVVVPASDSIEIYDRSPPRDDCRLAVSYLRLAPVDWTGLPISKLIAITLEGDKRPIIARGNLIHVERPDLEAAWAELRFVDPLEKRPACSRVAIARGSGIQALITLDFWLDDAVRIEPVWDEVMRSVELGRHVEDPTRGDVLQ